MICTKPNKGIVGRRSFLMGLGATALSACTSPVQTPLATRVETDNNPLSRFRLFADDGPDEWRKHLHPPSSLPDPSAGPNVLALSGGGENGAFGAGALVGWSKRGDRPNFDLVTGISTSALIAPFAFMGPDYDNVLTRVFAESDAGDIMRMRPFQAVFSHALYDTAPLAALITKHTPPSFRRAIAQKAQSGKEPAHCHLGT